MLSATIPFIPSTYSINWPRPAQFNRLTDTTMDTILQSILKNFYSATLNDNKYDKDDDHANDNRARKMKMMIKI